MASRPCETALRPCKFAVSACDKKVAVVAVTGRGE